jgi:hypothetical protein
MPSPRLLQIHQAGTKLLVYSLHKFFKKLLNITHKSLFKKTFVGVVLSGSSEFEVVNLLALSSSENISMDQFTQVAL